jgi:hypothetical protein
VITKDSTQKPCYSFPLNLQLVSALEFYVAVHAHFVARAGSWSAVCGDLIVGIFGSIVVGMLGNEVVGPGMGILGGFILGNLQILGSELRGVVPLLRVRHRGAVGLRSLSRLDLSKIRVLVGQPRTPRPCG